MADNRKNSREKFEQARNGLVQNMEQQKALINQQRIEMGAIAQQNQTLKQAAEIAAQTTGQQELGASTEATLKKYGRPSVSKKSEIVTKNPNIIVNNTVTNYNGGAGPTQGRPLVVKNPAQQDGGMARFKAWLSGVFARQNEENSKREREFRKQDGYLSRTSSKLMKRLETFGSNIAESMSPKKVAAAMGSQMKTLLFLFGTYFLLANWSKVIDFVGTITAKVTGLVDYFVGKDPQKSFMGDLKHLLGGEKNETLIQVIKGLAKDTGKVISAFFTKEWNIRAEAVKQVKFPDFKGTKGDTLAILGRLGDYLVDVLTCLTTGAKGVEKSISHHIQSSSDVATNERTASGSWVNRRASYGKTWKSNTWMGDAASVLGGNTMFSGDISGDHLSNNMGATVRQAKNIGALLQDKNKANTAGVMVGMERLKNTAIRKGTAVVPGDFFNSFSYLGIPASSLERLTRGSKIGRYKYVLAEKDDEDYASEGRDTGRVAINSFVKNKIYDVTDAGFLGREGGDLFGAESSYMTLPEALMGQAGWALSKIRRGSPWYAAASNEANKRLFADKYVLKMVPLSDPRPAQEIDTPNGKRSIFEMLEVTPDQIKDLESLIKTQTNNSAFEFNTSSEGSMRSLEKTILSSLKKRGNNRATSDLDTSAYDRLRAFESYAAEENNKFNHIYENTRLAKSVDNTKEAATGLYNSGVDLYNQASGYVQGFFSGFGGSNATRTGAIIAGNAPIYKQLNLKILGAGAKNNNPGNNTGSNPFSISSKGAGGSGNKHHTLYRNLEDGYAGNVWHLIKYLSGKTRYMSANPTLRNVLSAWVDGQSASGKQMSNERIAKYEKDSGIKADTHIPLTKDNLLRLVLAIGKHDSGYVNPSQAKVAVDRAWSLWEQTSGKINTTGSVQYNSMDYDYNTMEGTATQSSSVSIYDSYSAPTARGVGSVQTYGVNYSSMPATPTGSHFFPIQGDIVVTSPFGPRVSPTTGASSNHKGIDIRANFIPVYATENNGIVSSVNHEASKSSGKYIRVIYKHENGDIIETTYMHLSEIGVRAGQVVNAGDYLGKSGNTGIGTGAHLHFEVTISRNGKKFHVDPAEYLAYLAQQGGIRNTVVMKGSNINLLGNLGIGPEGGLPKEVTSPPPQTAITKEGAWEKSVLWFKNAEDLYKNIKSGTATDADVVSLMGGMKSLWVNKEMDLIAGKNFSDEERKAAIAKIDSVKDVKTFLESMKQGAESQVGFAKDVKGNLNFIEKSMGVGKAADALVEKTEKRLDDINKTLDKIEKKEPEIKEESKEEEKKEPEKKKESWEIEMDKWESEAKSSWDSKINSVKREEELGWGTYTGIKGEDYSSRRMRLLIGSENWADFRKQQLSKLGSIIKANYEKIKRANPEILAVYKEALKNPYGNGVSKLETMLYNSSKLGAVSLDEIKNYRRESVQYFNENLRGGLYSEEGIDRISALEENDSFKETLNNLNKTELGSRENYNAMYSILGFNGSSDLKEPEIRENYIGNFRVLRTEEEAREEDARYLDTIAASKKGASATTDEVKRVFNNFLDRLGDQKQLYDFYPPRTVMSMSGAQDNNPYWDDIKFVKKCLEDIREKETDLLKEKGKRLPSPETIDGITSKIKNHMVGEDYENVMGNISRAELNKKSDKTKRDGLLNKANNYSSRLQPFISKGTTFSKIEEFINNTYLEHKKNFFGIGGRIEKNVNLDTSENGPLHRNKDLANKYFSLKTQASKSKRFYKSINTDNLKSFADTLAIVSSGNGYHSVWWESIYPAKPKENLPAVVELADILIHAATFMASSKEEQKRLLENMGIDANTFNNATKDMNDQESAEHLFGKYYELYGGKEKTYEELTQENLHKMQIAQTYGYGKDELARDKNGIVSDTYAMDLITRGEMDEKGRMKFTLTDGKHFGEEVYATEEEYANYLKANKEDREDMYQGWIKRVSEGKLAYNEDAFKFIGSDANGNPINLRLVKLEGSDMVPILDEDYDKFKKIIKNEKYFNKSTGTFTGDGLKEVNSLLNNYNEKITGSLKYYTKDESGNWVETDKDVALANGLTYKVGKYGEEIDEAAQQKMVSKGAAAGAAAGGVLGMLGETPDAKAKAEDVKVKFAGALEAQTELAAQTVDSVDNLDDTVQKGFANVVAGSTAAVNGSLSVMKTLTEIVDLHTKELEKIYKQMATTPPQ